MKKSHNLALAADAKKRAAEEPGFSLFDFGCGPGRYIAPLEDMHLGKMAILAFSLNGNIFLITTPDIKGSP